MLLAILCEAWHRYCAMNGTNKLLIDLVDEYRRATGNRHAESYISRLAVGSWDVFDRLRDGKGITTKRADRLVVWFASNWPQKGEWPRGLPRPPGAKSEQAA